MRPEAVKGNGSRKRAVVYEDDEEKTAKYLKQLAREANRNAMWTKMNDAKV